MPLVKSTLKQQCAVWLTWLSARELAWSVDFCLLAIRNIMFDIFRQVTKGETYADGWIFLYNHLLKLITLNNVKCQTPCTELSFKSRNNLLHFLLCRSSHVCLENIPTIQSLVSNNQNVSLNSFLLWSDTEFRKIYMYIKW